MATALEHDHERMEQTLIHVREILFKTHTRIKRQEKLPDRFAELLCLEIDVCLSLNEHGKK